MMRPRLPFLAIPFIALASAPSAAAQDHWGAVAAGPDGAAAQAIEQSSRGTAREAAIKSCGGRCTHLVTFYRACAAIATGAGGYGWAAGPSVQDTGERALQFCMQRGKDCRLRIVACSGND